MPVKSVGVVGDARRYEYVVALRAVETIDFMTARWAHLPYELLETVSNRIINEISGISRYLRCELKAPNTQLMRGVRISMLFLGIFFWHQNFCRRGLHVSCGDGLRITRFYSQIFRRDWAIELARRLI